MPLSAAFTVEGAANPAAHLVTYDATVDLAIASLAYNTIAWSIVGTSKSDQSAPSITLSGSPLGSTASFVMPSDPLDGLGRSFRVSCRVTDAAGNHAIQYGIVGAANGAGFLPIPVGEESGERNATHGWTDEINAALAGAGSGGGGSMSVQNTELTVSSVDLTATAISASFDSDAFRVAGQGFSVSIYWTGGGSGSFKLQGSNDPLATPAAASWEDIDNTEYSSASGSPAFWNIENCNYFLARVVYTHSASTLTMTGRATYKG